MGIGKQQKATWAVRGKMYSPGRPPGWRRGQVRRFWLEIAKGATSEDAAICGRGGIRRWHQVVP